MAASNRLYPPILDYSMPAFALESNQTSVRIYFALSVYNAESEIRSVHMTVRYLSSNENALADAYKAKIKIAVPILDNERLTRQDRYYVELSTDDLKEKFVPNTIYKIQLRSSALEYDSSKSSPSASWFNANYMNFSEWSTVALIKPINPPEYSVLGLEDADNGASVNFTSADSVFTISYAQGDSSEPLRQWRTRLYNGTKTTLLADSGEMLYSNYDYLPTDEKGIIAFDSILPYQMLEGQQYILQLDLLTRNGYFASSDYKFTCTPASGTDFEGDISFFINENEGYAEVHVTTPETTSTNLVIRRTSSESGSTIWEDVALKTAVNEIVDWTFRDFSIESGVWYRYGVQTRDTRGRRGALIEQHMTPIKMGEFEDAFLLEEGGRQLKLKYDFQISSANITVGESKTDTIGSKYPFVRRNGNMYYRTFQCTGLITGYMDRDAHLFTTPNELFHNETSRYKAVRDQINQEVNQYDYTYEREFREKVQQFLYDDKVKLFKSLQEGNILVKLMNISLTPKNELGRLLYTFSAQAVEIGEPSLQNLNNYKIQVVDTYASAINFSENKLGQLSSFSGYDNNNQPIFGTFAAGQNILQNVGKQYAWNYTPSGSVTKDTKNSILVNNYQLTHLKVEFESEPYLIERNGQILTPFTGTDTTDKDLILGWLLQIDNQTILVQPPNNIYELKEDGLIINSTSTIAPLAETQMSVYYLVQLEEEVDSSLVPISISYYKINGQLYRTFDPLSQSDNVINLLKNKYSRSESEEEQYELDSVFTVDIEAEPGTVFYAQSSVASEPTKFVINENGNLYLDPGVAGVTIKNLYCGGREIDTRYLDPHYTWDGLFEPLYDNGNWFDDLHNKGNTKPEIPQEFDDDNDGTQLDMFYRHVWSPCTKQDNIFNIQCPVFAIINYQIQQKKGVYVKG